MKSVKFITLTAVALITLSFFISSSASSKLNENVLSGSLAERLNSASEGETFNLIVQFEDEVTERDLRYLEILEFKIVQTFHIIPAVHVFGDRGAIEALSNYPRTSWIENNDRIKYNLDVSTAVINATNTWSRKIMDFGEELAPIDGSGVTVVVADTGIDATHPDLDYQEKVVLNLKKDIDHPGMWKEMENTDTFFGHGTHCAGIIGGTGEASAGARRGVAPGVSLIGLSIGDPWETNEIGGLEWVYDNSRPNANPFNIRAVSNSWGYEEQIDENFRDGVIQATMKLSYENNVVVVFAASNDGEDDHDGHESTTNVYGNVPSAISVAASQRDGTGMAAFSSRGHREQNDTWPDITAPGVSIMSAKDSTGKMGKTNTDNPYYIPASGTSMATPHIAGVVALLFQAAPSLRISDIHDDSSTEDPAFWESAETLIHETEYIMKVTADFIPSTPDNGVPDNFSYDLEGKPHDFAQGYGLVNVERAVGLALTLEKLREENPEATVRDAMVSYMNIINDTTTAEETDVIVSSWNGEYSLHNDQNTKPTFTTSQTHYVYISNDSKKLILDLSFPPINLDDNTVGAVTITMDIDDDGNADWEGELFDSSALNGQRHDEIDISSGDFASRRGNLWAFSIYGYAVASPLKVGELVIGGFRAPTIEYTTSVQQVLDFAGEDEVFVHFHDFRSSVSQLEFGVPSSEYEEGSIRLPNYEFNISRAFYVQPPPPRVEPQDSFLVAVIMNIVLGIIVCIAFVRRYIRSKRIDSKISPK